MPSNLSGLFRTLTWTDYSQVQGTDETASAALTVAPFNHSATLFQPVPGTKPTQFRLEDSFSVRVTFDGNKSFVMSLVFSWDKQEQDDLLHHEQGHYNLTALVCRDFFVDVMLLKSQSFSSPQAGGTAFQQIKRRTVDKILAIDKLYDDEVHPEQDNGNLRGPRQQDWDSSIQAAFTQARSPSSQAPDGTVHKVRLVDVLTKKGKRI